MGMMKREKNGASPPATVDLMALAECVERFSGKSVVLLADFVADAFQSGDITRVSREAPVLILRHRETHLVPGGGANAASNFVALGAKVFPITAVGDDAAGDWLLNTFSEKGVKLSGILRVRGWTTPMKTRFLAGWAHTVGQQVLRVDYEPNHPLPESARKKIKAILAAKLSHADALAVSDYGFGVTNPQEVHNALLRVRRKFPVTLDSRFRLTAYKQTGVTAATPNEPEMEALHHTAIGQNLEELERCGRATLAEMRLEALVVTRGRDGMAVFQRGQTTAHLPVHGSDQAVDVTGAGDTVLAAYTLGLASGASPLEAAHIANIAGGLVVMKRGTATVSREELQNAIRDAASGQPADP
jgi:rfaE bifunctional protein kinase chain/domain